MFNKVMRKKLYRLAWAKWGSEAQFVVFMEECAELIKAVSKYMRFGKKSAQPARDLVEEIADVEIMIEQVITMNDWENFRERIDQAKSDKLKRLANIVDPDCKEVF